MNTRELILTQFPGRTAVTLVEAGAAIGYEQQTCYNLHHIRKFPLRTYKQGRKPMVALTELIRYMEEKAGEKSTEQIELPKRRVGRPRNSERPNYASSLSASSVGVGS